MWILALLASCLALRCSAQFDTENVYQCIPLEAQEALFNKTLAVENADDNGKPLYQLLYEDENNQGNTYERFRKYTLYVVSNHEAFASVLIRTEVISGDPSCDAGRLRGSHLLQDFEDCPYVLINKDTQSKSKVAFRWVAPRCGCIKISAIVVGSEKITYRDGALTKFICERSDESPQGEVPDVFPEELEVEVPEDLTSDLPFNPVDPLEPSNDPYVLSFNETEDPFEPTEVPPEEPFEPTEDPSEEPLEPTGYPLEEPFNPTENPLPEPTDDPYDEPFEPTEDTFEEPVGPTQYPGAFSEEGYADWLYKMLERHRRQRHDDRWAYHGRRPHHRGWEMQHYHGWGPMHHRRHPSFGHPVYRPWLPAPPVGNAHRPRGKHMGLNPFDIGDEDDKPFPDVDPHYQRENREPNDLSDPLFDEEVVDTFTHPSHQRKGNLMTKCCNAGFTFAKKLPRGSTFRACLSGGKHFVRAVKRQKLLCLHKFGACCMRGDKRISTDEDTDVIHEDATFTDVDKRVEIDTTHGRFENVQEKYPDLDNDDQETEYNQDEDDDNEEEEEDDIDEDDEQDMLPEQGRKDDLLKKCCKDGFISGKRPGRGPVVRACVSEGHRFVREWKKPWQRLCFRKFKTCCLIAARKRSHHPRRRPHHRRRPGPRPHPRPHPRPRPTREPRPTRVPRPTDRPHHRNYTHRPHHRNHTTPFPMETTDTGRSQYRHHTTPVLLPTTFPAPTTEPSVGKTVEDFAPIADEQGDPEYNIRKDDQEPKKLSNKLRRKLRRKLRKLRKMH
ncbi:uncharacterized protein LOC106162260 [Lingula anatina]|uniref:Uncharacterized protein LOC106162260 n=1 Tax=Lingula anatina TaxID=7574 RepID=A0A1S3IAQ3_LINAN|nr:uncharacterized protein LOC106162260 [Lingula anatina]|eukprot:XP_013394936.1 uncharacterized protein LOC106162260 [Lingula anatina]